MINNSGELVCFIVLVVFSSVGAVKVLRND